MPMRPKDLAGVLAGEPSSLERSEVGRRVP
jgi:hypothetical protein